MKHLALVFFLFFAPLSAYCQAKPANNNYNSSKSNSAGRANNDYNAAKSNSAGRSVTLKGDHFSTEGKVNEKGICTFSNVPAGKYDVVFQRTKSDDCPFTISSTNGKAVKKIATGKSIARPASIIVNEPGNVMVDFGLSEEGIKNPSQY